ncbi:glycosyltransferase [Serratia sarumanii]
MFDYEVVVCTYNGERYIVEQLASIVGQTISPRRIIVSDDGSTDNTLKLIANFAATTSVPFDVQQRVAEGA